MLLLLQFGRLLPIVQKNCGLSARLGGGSLPGTSIFLQCGLETGNDEVAL